MGDPSSAHGYPVNEVVEVVVAVGHKRIPGEEIPSDGGPALQYFHQATCFYGAFLNGSIPPLDNLLAHWHHHPGFVGAWLAYQMDQSDRRAHWAPCRILVGVSLLEVMAWDTEGVGGTEEVEEHGGDAAAVAADAGVGVVDVAYVTCVDEDVAVVIGANVDVGVARDEG